MIIHMDEDHQPIDTEQKKTAFEQALDAILKEKSGLLTHQQGLACILAYYRNDGRVIPPEVFTVWFIKNLHQQYNLASFVAASSHMNKAQRMAFALDHVANGSTWKSTLRTNIERLETAQGSIDPVNTAKRVISQRLETLLGQQPTMKQLQQVCLIVNNEIDRGMIITNASLTNTLQGSIELGAISQFPVRDTGDRPPRQRHGLGKTSS
ncbi:MAG: hypothetical protein WCG83_01945 [Candidatus Peregrinibacteria bacterium]